MIYRDAVPESFERSILAATARRKIQHPTLMAAFAACNLIRHFISRERADDYWELIHTDDLEQSEAGVQRLQEVAEFIFFALRQGNPQGWFDRLRRSDIDKNIQEVIAARFFSALGYNVKEGLTTGTKTLDFDFSVSRSDAAFNVEVSELSGLEFTHQNLMNNLKMKRTQMPRGTSNVIYCILPHRWHHNSEEWIGEAMNTAKRFFGSTSRISCVMLAFEAYIRLPNSPNLPTRVSSVVPLLNPRAEHPLTLGAVLGPERLEYRVPLATYRIVPGSRRSDFVRWFDRMLWCEERRLPIDPDSFWTQFARTWSNGLRF
jgi:hypothetical protein